MVVFLVLSAGFMPWKDKRLAQFDNSIALIVVFASTCGLAFTHFTVQMNYYGQDTSEAAIHAKEDAQYRMSIFSYVLYAALALVGCLFAALVIYCAHWMKNMDKLAKEEAVGNDILVQLWLETVNHEHFPEQFGRLIATGTYCDIQALNAFLGNLQARLEIGGLKKSTLMDGEHSPKSSRRLRTDQKSEPATWVPLAQRVAQANPLVGRMAQEQGGELNV